MGSDSEESSQSDLTQSELQQQSQEDTQHDLVQESDPHSKLEQGDDFNKNPSSATKRSRESDSDSENGEPSKIAKLSDKTDKTDSTDSNKGSGKGPKDGAGGEGSVGDGNCNGPASPGAGAEPVKSQSPLDFVIDKQECEMPSIVDSDGGD